MSQHSIIPHNLVNDCATYSQLCEITSQLVITVVNSKEKSNSVTIHVTEWLRRLRINDNFQPSFTTMNSNELSIKVKTSTSLSNVLLISAVAAPAKPQHCSKRLVSCTDNINMIKFLDKPGDTKKHCGTHVTISTCVKDF